MRRVCTTRTLSPLPIRIPDANLRMPMDVSYPPPLDQLLSLGDPDSSDWLDYRALGITDEHVPLLIDVMRDERLSWDSFQEGEDEARYWAPVHAWRALGQLRPEQAVDPLLTHLVRHQEDDWAMEEIPEVLGTIGVAALVPVADALARAATESESALVPVLATALKEIAHRHPPLRDRAVGLLIGQLIEWAEQSGEVNAWLVSALLDLRAVESAGVIQAAFEAGDVDESINGDWEDVQVGLGLLARRTTPRPRYTHWGAGEPFTAPPRPPKPAPIPGSNSAAAKARSLRKAQKAGKRKRGRK